MAKKIYFKNINVTTVATINNINDIIFGCNLELRNLAKAKADTNKKITALENVKAETSSDSEKEFTEEQQTELDNLKKAVNVISDKQKNTRSFFNDSLYDHKDKADNAFRGLYTDLGVGNDLYNAYINLMSEGNEKEWHTAINSLMQSFGLNLNDKLTKMLAKKLSFCVGLDESTSSQILKGQLTRDKKVKKFQSLFTKTLCEYMQKTCESICIPTAEFHSIKVSYDSNLKVEKLEVVEKEVETEEL